MSDIYKGLCISGPLDGQWRSNNVDTFRAAAKVETFVTPTLPGIPFENSSMKTTRYIHKEFIIEGQPFNLWIPSDMSLVTAFKLLYSTYAIHGSR